MIRHWKLNCTKYVEMCRGNATFHSIAFILLAPPVVPSQAPDSKGPAPKFAPGVTVWVPWDDDEVFSEAVVHAQEGDIVTVKKAKGKKNVRVTM